MSRPLGEGLKITLGGKISESEYIAAHTFMTHTHSHSNFAFRSHKKKKKNNEIFLYQGNLGFICAGFRRMPTGR